MRGARGQAHVCHQREDAHAQQQQPLHAPGLHPRARPATTCALRRQPRHGSQLFATCVNVCVLVPRSMVLRCTLASWSAVQAVRSQRNVRETPRTPARRTTRVATTTSLQGQGFSSSLRAGRQASGARRQVLVQAAAKDDGPVQLATAALGTTVDTARLLGALPDPIGSRFQSSSPCSSPVTSTCVPSCRYVAQLGELLQRQLCQPAVSVVEGGRDHLRRQDVAHRSASPLLSPVPRIFEATYGELP